MADSKFYQTSEKLTLDQIAKLCKLKLPMNVDKKRIFIAGEMAELGKDQVYYHEKICKYADGKVEEFLCIGKLWKEGLSHIPKIGKSFSSKVELLDYINTNISKESIILVKGSRSTGMDFIADELKV